MKYEDYLMMENAEAHLHVVLGNLTEANDLLSSALLKKADTDNALSAVNVLIDTARAELEKTTQYSQSVAAAIEDRLMSVSKRELEITQREYASADLLHSHANTVSNLKIDAEALESKIAQCQADHDNLFRTNQELYKEVSNISEHIGVTEGSLAALKKESDALKVSMQEEREIHDKAIAAALKKLDETNKLIFEAELHAANAAKPLEAREEIIKGKEANLLIYQQRLIDLFAHYFPGVTAPRL